MTADLLTKSLHRAAHYLLHLARAHRKGHGVHSPFVYALCENVFYNEHPHYVFQRLHKLRGELLRNEKMVDAGSFGAGSSFTGKQQRMISDIAAHGISSEKQSEVLYRICNYMNITTVVELGTSVGLNTLYLGLCNPAAQVYTIEGSADLSAFAKSLASKNGLGNVNFLVGDFDDLLPSVIERIKGACLFYIDGNHTREATVRYFEQLLPYAREGSVMVFDDIYWSRGMTQAWKMICAHPQVNVSIDAYHSGYVFLKQEFREKSHFRLFV